LGNYGGSLRNGGFDVIAVDAAWHPDWISTEQVRYYKLYGDVLEIRTAKQTHPAFGSRELYGVLRWRKACWLAAGCRLRGRHAQAGGMIAAFLEGR
jgi:hypothetical protein